MQQLLDRVRVVQGDALWHTHDNRRVVEDDTNTCVREPVGDCLRRLRRNRHHPDPDVLGAERLLQLLQGLNDDLADTNADLTGVVVEDRCHHESMLPEPRVSGYRRPEVAGTHEREPVRMVGTENMLDALDEYLDIVADATFPE